MRWTWTLLSALVAALVAVPHPAGAQSRADTLVVVTEVGPNMLDIHAPGGFEDYFREVAAAVESGGRDPAVLAEIGSRYDIL